MDKYGYIGIETLLNYCENSKDHAVTPNEFMRMKRVRMAEPHWIPVSERLPERGKDVLVTRDYDGREDFNKSCRYVEVASSYGEEDAITWNSYSDEYKMTPKNHHVIAWMPLPEPYREDGE